MRRANTPHVYDKETPKFRPGSEFLQLLQGKSKKKPRTSRTNQENISKHRTQHIRIDFESCHFRRKFQILKISQKSFPRIQKSQNRIFPNLSNFHVKSRTSIPLGGPYYMPCMTGAP